MEIREITTYREDLPFVGYGVWIVVDESNRKAHLLHPIHLCEMYLREYELVRASGAILWPHNNSRLTFNIDKFLFNFKERIKFCTSHGRSFPVNTVAKALAGLENSSIEEVTRFIGSAAVNEYGESVSRLSTKTSREYALKPGVDVSRVKGRPLTLVNAFREVESASIHQITALVDGKLQTKSDLSRVVTYFVNKLASQGILEIVA